MTNKAAQNPARQDAIKSQCRHMLRDWAESVQENQTDVSRCIWQLLDTADETCHVTRFPMQVKAEYHRLLTNELLAWIEQDGDRQTQSIMETLCKPQTGERSNVR